MDFVVQSYAKTFATELQSVCNLIYQTSSAFGTWNRALQ